MTKNTALPQSTQQIESLILSRIESIGLNSIAQITGIDSQDLYRTYKQDAQTCAKIFALLGLHVAYEDDVHQPQVIDPDARPYLDAPVIELESSALVFPYATRELKAMHAAAVKYWVPYTPERRQPTQKEIGIEIGEILGLPLQANSDPARKAISLASAIKPDSISDA